MYDIEKKITDAIEIMVKKYIKDLQLTPRPMAKITSANGDGTYNLTYNGQTLINIKGRIGSSYVYGDVVYLIIPNGNLSSVFIDTVVL